MVYFGTVKVDHLSESGLLFSVVAQEVMGTDYAKNIYSTYVQLYDIIGSVIDYKEVQTTLCILSVWKCWVLRALPCEPCWNSARV